MTTLEDIVADGLAETCMDPKGKNGCDAFRHKGQALRLIAYLESQDVYLHRNGGRVSEPTTTDASASERDVDK